MTAPQRRVPTVYRIIPAATFVLGLVLGSVLVAVGLGGGDDTSGTAPAGPSPTPTASGSPSPTGAVDVTIPAACRKAAENIEEATTLLRRSVGSFKDFHPDRIVDLLNRLETLDSQTRPLVKECSHVGVSQASASP